LAAGLISQIKEPIQNEPGWSCPSPVASRGRGRVTDPMPVALRWSRTRVPFVSSFCCPPNLVRIIAEFADYAYGKTDDAIWVNLYGGSVLEIKLAGVKIFDVMIPSGMQLSARYDRRLLDGIVVLEGLALVRSEENWAGKLYQEFQPADLKRIAVKFIPHSVWQNRGPSESLVWLPLAGFRSTARFSM
jgi:DUF1680 family protein